MILIIDFDDSFTFNIASSLSGMGVESLVIFFKDYIDNFQDFSCYKYIIWGPGPGHPSEYASSLRKIFDEVLNDLNYCHLGICLGHQLIMQYLGAKIIKREKPHHGFSKLLNLDQSWQKILKTSSEIQVQFYNSLIAELGSKCGNQLIIDDELMAYYDKNILSYQFHPESVATRDSSLFFQAYFDLFN